MASFNIVKHLIILYSLIQSMVVVSIEIGCDKISATRVGRKFCILRNIKSEQYTNVKIKNDGYLEQRHEIVFDNCSFYAVPFGLFEAYPNLQTIYMWNTSVRTIPWKSFQNANHLTAFDISHNNITALDGNDNADANQNLGTFSLAPNLIRLTLSHNHICNISERAFIGLHKVTHLYLDHNKIELLAPHTFEPLIKLAILYLQQNFLKKIESNLFNTNQRLTHIYLQNNDIAFVEGDVTFKHLSNVEEFDCHNNPIVGLNHVVIDAVKIDIRNINANGLFIGQRTKNVQASDNKISYIVVANGSIGLQHLDLSNNNLTKMGNLTHFNQLLTLDLSNNQLTDISIEYFSGMSKLEILKLHNCGLQTLKYGLFSHKTNLKELDISFNQLIRIDFDMLISMGKLKTLYLEGNNITDLDMSSVSKNFPALTKIGIAQNNWKCQNLALIIKYLESAGIELNSRGLIRNAENINGIPCSSAREYGQKLLALPPNVISAHGAHSEHKFEAKEIKSIDIEKLQETCRFSLTNANDMEVIIQLNELKYDVYAYLEAIGTIASKIETILEKIHVADATTEP